VKTIRFHRFGTEQSVHALFEPFQTKIEGHLSHPFSANDLEGAPRYAPNLLSRQGYRSGTASSGGARRLSRCSELDEQAASVALGRLHAVGIPGSTHAQVNGNAGRRLQREARPIGRKRNDGARDGPRIREYQLSGNSRVPPAYSPRSGPRAANR
jgi:hypothetical protein